MGFTLIASTYMGIVLWVRGSVIAQHQLPYLNLGPSVPALIYKKMEQKPKFEDTQSFADFCKENDIKGLNIKSYTVKSGPRKGLKGLFAQCTIADVQIDINVASALVPKHKELTASMLEISNVTWPSGDTSVLLHGVGGDAHYVEGY